MSDENQDLLGLCRLSLMEETIKDSPGNDRDSTLGAIHWKQRQLVVVFGFFIYSLSFSTHGLSRSIPRHVNATAPVSSLIDAYS